MSLFLLVAVLLAGGEPSAASPPLPPRVIITKPEWAQLPSGEAMARVYPDLAAREEVGGRVLLQCVVRASGALDQCGVLEETPPDYGFGRAALMLAPEFRVKPQTVDGRPVDGALVRVPVVFTVPREVEVTADVMLENYVQCFGVIGAELDANPGQQRLVPALAYLKKLALELGVHAQVGDEVVHARLNAARARPATDLAFRRTCHEVVDGWLAKRR